MRKKPKKRETEFLKRYDGFKNRVETMVDMPNPKFHLLFRFLRQNDEKLSKRALESEFAPLTEKEVREIEEAYSEFFEPDS